jgi:hypothetical protein
MVQDAGYQALSVSTHLLDILLMQKFLLPGTAGPVRGDSIVQQLHNKCMGRKKQPASTLVMGTQLFCQTTKNI